MKINVIGANSSLGKKVMNELLIQGGDSKDLKVTVRNLEKAEEYKEEGIEVLYGDYDNLESMEKSFKDSEILVIIPSRAPVEQRISQINNTISAAKKAGVKRVIFSSIVTAGYFDSDFKTVEDIGFDLENFESMVLIKKENDEKADYVLFLPSRRRNSSDSN